MSEKTPSPARRQAEPSRNGMASPPWDQALLASVRNLERRVVEAETGRTEALDAAQHAQAKLRECRRRLENWKLRQQAWTEERSELLRRLELLTHEEPRKVF